jgi:hypothetical protein
MWDFCFGRAKKTRSSRPEDSRYTCRETYGTYYIRPEPSITPRASRPRGSTRQAPGPTRQARGSTRQARGSTRQARGSTRHARGSARHARDAKCDCTCCHHEPLKIDCGTGRPSLSKRHIKSEQATWRRPKSSATIDVHDTTRGPFWGQDVPVFSMSIRANETMQDVIDTLAPKGSGSEVVVVWDNEVRSLLDKHASLSELREHGRRLEIRKKHVHWSR